MQTVVAEAVVWTDVAGVVILGLQLLLLLVAALVARQQVAEAKEMREDQSRPFVVIDIDSPERPFLYLVVKNIGTTMARDVTFSFNEIPKSTMSHAKLQDLKMFRQGISSLPPGKEIRTLFDTAIKRHDSDLPDEYEVTVRYTGSHGTPYEEKMDLDFGIYWNRLSVRRYTVHDIHSEIQNIAQELDKWTARLGGGLAVVTPKDVRKRADAIERQIEAARDEGGPAAPPSPPRS